MVELSSYYTAGAHWTDAHASLHVVGAREPEPCFNRRRVRRGQQLFQAGTTFAGLYAVCRGSFKTSIALKDGRQQVIGFQMTGETLGLDAVGYGTHASDATALEDGEVYLIPISHLSQPAVQRRLQQVMSRELVRDHGIMVLLGTMRSDERLAAFLLNLAARLAARGFRESEFELRMTREEIGSYLGLSLETVSRAFTRLQDAGLLEVQARHVLILDPLALRRVTERQEN